jgi:hypothetical protein
LLVGDSKQYLILPGFGIISHVIVSAAKKSIFGYLGMVYGAQLSLFFSIRELKYKWNSFFENDLKYHSKVAFIVWKSIRIIWVVTR